MQGHDRSGDRSLPRTFGFHGLLAALLAAVLLFSGCLRSTVTPVPVRAVLFEPDRRAETLVVFLPGRGGSMDDFARQGLERILREAGVRADTVSVDAHLGYYFKRTVIERLRDDVLVPARARGYRRIVLVGVSLGGLGSLLCERDQPGLADALVLLSPYLGDKARLFAEIDAAGGPAKWAAGRERFTGVVEEEVWTFLGQRAGSLPPTWLAYGTDDRLAEGHRRLAALLPGPRVRVLAGGGHDWETWRSLWRGVCVETDLFEAEKAR